MLNQLQRFKAALVTGRWVGNPEPLVRDPNGAFVLWSDVEKLLSANQDQLVLTLLRDDSKIDSLLQVLDQGAQSVGNSFEYGLPLYADGEKEVLRKIVLKWIDSL